jgi:GT2 family glycosyltransferase
MQLSVIILNYNVSYFLEQCVLSVQKALKNIESEIIVVDNASVDDSCNRIKSRFPEVQLIQNQENIGFPEGNNIGVKVAKGAYICVLNPDTVVAEDTFIKVLAFAERQKIAPNEDPLGIIGVKLIDGSGAFLPESKRGIPTPWVAFTKIFGLYKWFPNSRLFNTYYAQDINENQTGKVAILVGAFMVMKRSLYNEIGGFDKNCFMYSDDIDLSYRVLQKGKTNYYFHDTTVIHYKGESTVKDKTYMRRFQEAMNFFYKKHFKVSLFFTFFMKIGIVFFSIFKRFQGQSKAFPKPSSYIFVSNNESLRKQIEQKLSKEVRLSTINALEFLPQTEIIFDTTFVSYQEIISLMNNNCHKKCTFKILPENSNFIIGSNSSNQRGEIIVF